VNACPECGAPLAPGTACREHLHELLLLEARVPGAPGALPHFLAVASYNLQHPSTFVPDALEGLRRTVADVLAGRATLDDARRRARAGARGSARVHRHTGEQPAENDRRLLDAWPTRWPITVADVRAADPSEYAQSVRAWAASVVAALEGIA
jgi:hypothetical protein